jgi:DNA-binding response OmpR family regulator
MAKKILVVDDEPSIVSLLKARLEDSQYEVITAKDGQEALDKTSQEKPDLIILDIMLPKIDGYMVASLLTSDENTRDIPIVMLTARNLAQDIKAGMESGAVSYVQKPFNSDVLLGMIPTLINRKKRKEKEKREEAGAGARDDVQGENEEEDINKEIKDIYTIMGKFDGEDKD